MDSNHWKSRFHEKLATDINEPGSISIFATKPSEDYKHECFAKHLRAETVKRIEVNEQVKDIWTLPPSKPDNHWFDGADGSCLAASITGCTTWTPGGRAGKRKGRPKGKRRRPRRASKI